MKAALSTRSGAAARGVSSSSVAGVAGVARVALFAVVAVACGAAGFDPASKVDSVRLFVVKADKPFAKPGETVTLEGLTTDARKEKTRAAKLYWIPILCLNPPDDLYYLCFAPPGSASADAQAARLIPISSSSPGGAMASSAGVSGANLFASLPTGVDLAPFLPQGPTFAFTMPEDSVQERKGIPPYGLAIVFNIACAGRVEFAARDASGGAQQVPVLCSDESGKRLPPSDYVIGIARVYAWADRVNTNPVVESLTAGGNDVDLTAGITLDRCTSAKESECAENKIGLRVSEASWEPNPSEVTRDGELREQIWVDYYADLGTFDDEARLLFDTRQGRVSESDVKYRAPKDAADGTLWAVVHDNRGGAAWVSAPLHIR